MYLANWSTLCAIKSSITAACCLLPATCYRERHCWPWLKRFGVGVLTPSSLLNTTNPLNFHNPGTATIDVSTLAIDVFETSSAGACQYMARKTPVCVDVGWLSFFLSRFSLCVRLATSCFAAGIFMKLKKLLSIGIESSPGCGCYPALRVKTQPALLQFVSY